MGLLDIKPHQVSRDLRGYSVFFYGAPKTGKTTTACKFPGALLLAFEKKGYSTLLVQWFSLLTLGVNSRSCLSNSRILQFRRSSRLL